MKNMDIGYSTGLGKCLCGDSNELLKHLKDSSIDLIVTSPPYALQRKKEYGGLEQDEYVDWLCSFAETAFPKIKDTGSLVFDIGGAYEKGQPIYSLYQFRVLIKLCDELGYKLAQPFYWHNPSALPSPIEWVNKRKLRAKSSIETCWWVCKSSACKADVTQVLAPYSDRMKSFINQPEKFIGGDEANRPSGHQMKKGSWTHDNGGAIPSNMLNISNAESNGQYLRYCKALELKGHPARFPIQLPEFFIKFLTKPGDLVVDIFSGSNTTGLAAERLGRRWLAFDLMKEYVANSSFRFVSSVEEAKETYTRIMSDEFVEIKTQCPQGQLDFLN